MNVCVCVSYDERSVTFVFLSSFSPKQRRQHACCELLNKMPWRVGECRTSKRREWKTTKRKSNSHHKLLRECFAPHSLLLSLPYTDAHSMNYHSHRRTQRISHANFLLGHAVPPLPLVITSRTWQSNISILFSASASSSTSNRCHRTRTNLVLRMGFHQFFGECNWQSCRHPASSNCIHGRWNRRVVISKPNKVQRKCISYVMWKVTVIVCNRI